MPYKNLFYCSPEVSEVRLDAEEVLCSSSDSTVDNIFEDNQELVW